MKKRVKNFRKLMKIKLVLGALLISMFAVGQTHDTKNPAFKDWDTDNDNNISKSEFGDRYSKDYTHYWHGNTVNSTDNNKTGVKNGKSDMNSKNGMNTANSYTDDDFYHSTYNMWDTNRDQWLSEDEWKDGLDSSYKNYVKDDFKTIDKNGDGRLDFNEYHNSLVNSDYYSKYDKDRNKSLDDNEVSDMVFDSWDRDKNNWIDENEYNTYRKNYLDIQNPTSNAPSLK